MSALAVPIAPRMAPAEYEGFLDFLDAAWTLHRLTPRERDTWVHVRMGTSTQRARAEEEGVSEACISLRLRSADAKVAAAKREALAARDSLAGRGAIAA
jgi:hypothetical protein